MASAKRTCRKRRFPDEYSAAKWLVMMTAHAGRGDVTGRVPVRVYECPFCHGLHATSRPGRENGGDQGVWRYRGRAWPIPQIQVPG